jgi:hypothetical protein
LDKTKYHFVCHIGVISDKIHFQGGQKPMLNSILLSASLAFATIPVGELPKEILKEKKDINLAGFFIAEGKEGVKVYATPVVIMRSPKGYLVHWVQGQRITTGFGVLEDGTFSVAWKQGDVTGISIYKMTEKGLAGRWSTVLQSGEERLIRVAAFGEKGANDEEPDAN